MEEPYAGRPAPDVVEPGVPATEEEPEELLLTGDDRQSDRAYGGGAGRLVEPDAGANTDDEAQAIAELDDDRYDTLSPEEAALRVEDEPAGLAYDDDPGYVDDGDLGAG
jgi:hypothetical protein